MISDLMRQVAQKSIAADVEAQILFGTMMSVEPLKVQVDERFILEGDVLILPHYLERQEFRLIHEAQEHTMDKTYIIEPGLQSGDRVILLSLGGDYLILGKVGETSNVRQVVKK